MEERRITPRWWTREEGDAVRCTLCFRGCTLRSGAAGFCGVRLNARGTLVSPWLGRFCARAVDPIEKKPLAHWRPGTLIYSLGSVGCTMACPFCQNHEIAHPERPEALSRAAAALRPEELALEVRNLGLSSVAFTYNEPTLQAEYILEASPLLRENGIAVVLVTNGVMSEPVASELLTCTDAANVDLKAFDTERYRRLGGSLNSVKANIASWMRGGVHVELTHLVVPGLVDTGEGFDAMTDWIAAQSPSVPLHLSRSFPRLAPLRTADGHGAPVLPGRPGAGKAAACPPGERALTRFYESPMSPRISLTSRCRSTAAARAS